MITFLCCRIGHTAPRNDFKSSNSIDDTGWAEMEESEDFAVTDWMIRFARIFLCVDAFGQRTDIYYDATLSRISVGMVLDDLRFVMYL